MYYLGIDTSNYTTSAAIYDSENNLVIHNAEPMKKADTGIENRYPLY